MVQAKVHVRWWLRHYLFTVYLACMFTGMEPNQERVAWWVRKGVRIKLVPARAEVEA